MTPSCHTLFTSAGRRVSLVRLFRRALDAMCPGSQIVTADLKETAPAHFVGDVRELVPHVTDPGYIDRLKSICRTHSIRLLVPLIDTELHLLAPRRAEFESLGTQVLVSSVEATMIGLDKRLTHEFFQRAGLATPLTLDPQTVLDDPAAPYPLLLKPARGSSSVGVTRIENRRQLAFYLEETREPILQELLVGSEFTLDILADLQGRVRCVVPRLRIETRAGEISKGVTVKDAALIDAGRRLVEALPGPVGCITAQCFRTAQGELKFIEFNPRFGGGFPLSAAAGADFPAWIVAMVLGQDPDITINGWQEGVVMLRYDEAIFLRAECLDLAS